MKKKSLSIIFLTFIFLLFYNYSYAGLGIYYGNSVSRSQNSGTRYCSSGQNIVDLGKNRGGLPRSGAYSCMRMDNSAPVISINGNGYTSGNWTNNDVNLNISVSDSWPGVESVIYSINGTIYGGNTSFSLSFSEEGTYNISITAKDKVTNSSRNARGTSSRNTSKVNFIVRIDKSKPVLINPPEIDSSWKNVKPNISFEIKDNYKGKNIEIKEFTCSRKPENSFRNIPVINDGKIIGECDPSIKNCLIDSNYTPNINSCNWDCNDGYTKYNGICYKSEITLSCNSSSLPKDSYNYNKDDNILFESNLIKSYWITPFNVSSDGEFLSKFNSGLYSPNIEECSFDCKEGYHNENGKCVNDVAIICCKAEYPLVTVGGIKVDCTNPINSTNLQCIYNNLCGGYVKDVIKEWKNNKWVYTDGTLSGNDSATACGFEPINNSNGMTCDPGYYLVGEGGSTPTCTKVPTGEWSGQENIKKSCTNKPNNAYYISHTSTTGGNNDCPWSCNNNYNKTSGKCEANTKKDQACSGLPPNATWNNVNNIDQTWNGYNWSPSLIGTYNTSSSNKECRFKCNNNYTFDLDTNSCIADTKIYNCSGLPDNAIWNNVSNYLQTWNGYNWSPSETISKYSEISSDSECLFKCEEGKNWNSVTKTCN